MTLTPITTLTPLTTEKQKPPHGGGLVGLSLPPCNHLSRYHGQFHGAVFFY